MGLFADSRDWLFPPCCSAVPSPQQQGAHVGSEATWQRQCWIELCQHTKPIPSSAFHQQPSLLMVLPRQKGQAMQFQTLLHLCPTQLCTTRTKKRKSRWKQPQLCEQAARDVLCQEVGVEPLLTIPTCMTTSVSHPHLGHGQGRMAASAGPAPAMVMKGGHVSPRKHWS